MDATTHDLLLFSSLSARKPVALVDGESRSVEKSGLTRCYTAKISAYAVLGILLASPTHAHSIGSEPLEPKSERDAAIVFSHDLPRALESARKTGKPLALVFAAVWCPNCRRFDQSTLSATEVQALGDEFTWVRVDIDRETSLARSYDIKVVPQVLLLDSQGVAHVRIVGVVTPAAFHGNLTDFLMALPAPASPTPLVINGNPQTRLTWRPSGFREKSACFSNVGFGPLRIRSQSPFQALRLALAPRAPSTLGRGQKEIRAAATWVNIWSQNDTHFLDLETLQLNGALAYGISDTWQIELELESASRFGGGLDSLIQGFHNTFGIDQDGRDEVPRGDFRFEVGRPSVALDHGDRGEFARAFVVSVQNNITCGTEKLPALAYAFTWRYELEGDDLQGGSRSDFGFSLSAARRFGKVYTYLTLGFASFGRETFRGIELRDTQTSLLAAAEWRRWPRTSLILQYLVTEGAVDNLDDFSRPSNEIVFGWKKELRPRKILEIAAVENVITLGNSPDFGIHIGFTQRF